MNTPQIITIMSSTRALVISERIVDDGRERHENGRDVLEPGEKNARSFIVDSAQSIRVVDFPVEPEPEQPADGSVVDATTETN